MLLSVLTDVSAAVARSCWYPTFAPLAVTAIGMMPLPLLHRAIIINMQRASVRLERFDEDNCKFAASREQIARWATTCSLAQEFQICRPRCATARRTPGESICHC